MAHGHGIDEGLEGLSNGGTPLPEVEQPQSSDLEKKLFMHGKKVLGDHLANIFQCDKNSIFYFFLTNFVPFLIQFNCTLNRNQYNSNNSYEVSYSIRNGINKKLWDLFIETYDNGSLKNTDLGQVGPKVQSGDEIMVSQLFPELRMAPYVMSKLYSFDCFTIVMSTNPIYRSLLAVAAETKYKSSTNNQNHMIMFNNAIIPLISITEAAKKYGVNELQPAILDFIEASKKYEPK